MRSGGNLWRGVAIAAPLLFVLAIGVTTVRGDEPGRLGRLFRFNGSSAPSAGSESKPSLPAPGSRPAAPRTTAPPLPPVDPGPAPTPALLGASRPSPGPGPSPRLVPQPRVSRAFTDADPIVTRVALGRSAEGGPFGMFLQVFADGTILDSEGVHQVGREAIQPVLEALESSELHRLRGHCGGPPTDYLEQVQMIVYERSLGRLRANAFSFSGNTQGCDPSVRRLETALEALQARLSRPATATATAAPGAPPPTPTADAPAVPYPAPPAPVLPAPAGPTIRLNEEPSAPVARPGS